MATDKTDLPPAGFVSRAVALTIDAVIIGISIALGALTMAMVWSLVSLRVKPRLDEEVVAALVAAGGTLFGLAYHSICWTLTGRTPGKAIIGVQVVGRNGERLSFGRAVLRFVCYWVSTFPLGLGFLWAIGPKRHRVA